MIARVWIAVLVLGTGLFACSDDENTTAPPALINQYDQTHGWTCADSENCQDVFNIRFTAGTSVTFEVRDLTGNSVAQIALYAPGVPLGDINLLTGTDNEYRCNDNGDCATMPPQVINDFPLAAGGVYRLAITRDWGASCGGEGTYRLVIGADKRFEFPVRTVNDVATLAPGAECPVVIR